MPSKKQRQQNKKKRKDKAKAQEAREDLGTPVMNLPDELLSHIFSLILSISFKLDLERVCKRFQRVSKLSSSWKGVDCLVLNLRCRGHSEEMSAWKLDMYCGLHLDVQGELPDHKTTLNERKIALHKWPAAIEVLLKRTTVTKFSVHVDQQKRRTRRGNWEKVPLPTGFITTILSVLRDNQKQLKLESLGLHLWAKEAKELIVWALEHSTKTLKQLVVLFEDGLDRDGYWTKEWAAYWPMVQKCAALESVSVAPPSDMDVKQITTALEGKPLTHFGVCVPLDPIANSLAPTVCNGASGKGIESMLLATDEPLSLNELSSQMNEQKREVLKKLCVEDYGEVTSADHYLPLLAQIPRLFPRLTLFELHLEATDRNSHVTDPALLLNAAFFDACEQDPSIERKVVFSILNVRSYEQFKEAATQFSNASGVEVEIKEEDGKGLEDEESDKMSADGSEDDGWLEVKMTRGNATVTIDMVCQDDDESDFDYDYDNYYDSDDPFHYVDSDYDYDDENDDDVAGYDD